MGLPKCTFPRQCGQTLSRGTPNSAAKNPTGATGTLKGLPRHQLQGQEALQEDQTDGCLADGLGEAKGTGEAKRAA
eukprot:5551787-Pyramimonas_sp.AAC.1